MQITSATFTDPTMRSQLQQYYDHKKTELIEAWETRAPLPQEVSFTDSDGKTHKAQALNLSGEKMAKALVGFDKWLEFQAESFDNNGFGPKQLAMAQKHLDQLEKLPAGSSSDALAEAQANYSNAKAWHDQWQKNMNEMQSFLLSLQETA